MAHITFAALGGQELDTWPALDALGAGNGSSWWEAAF